MQCTEQRSFLMAPTWKGRTADSLAPVASLTSKPLPKLSSIGKKPPHKMAGVLCSPSAQLPLIPKWSPKFKTQPLPKLLPKFPSSSAFPTTFLHSTFTPLAPRASVGSAEYVVEPVTNVEFPKELSVPGCSESLVLLGTGYREKVFAIIGVKVYAAGFYAKASIGERLDAWKGISTSELLEDLSLFSSVFQAPLEKALKIKLVRDVDGKTFWDALNDVISPRIKEPTGVDETALSTFRNTFQGRELKQGTIILLTWIQPSAMLVSISREGFPSNVDAEINSQNATLALFDAFFGDSPVSPTLKASVANGLTMVLN